MPLTLTTTLVAVTVTLPTCSWDNPGHSPYMGSIEEAVDRYRDIPPEVRQRLKAKMRTRTYDDIATITRDKVEGKRSYSNLRDMHFGGGRVCRQITRDKWKPTMVERGLVYCEGEHCLIVPTVCRNVSRITADTPLDIETAAGPEDDPPPQPNELGSRRFAGDPDPIPTRRFSLDPPPGDPPPLEEVVTDAGGPPPPPGPPRDPLPPLPPIPPIPPVDEPSTWALMIMGLGFMVAAAQRRRARLAAGSQPDARTPAGGLSSPGA